MLTISNSKNDWHTMVGTGYAFPAILALMVVGQVWLNKVWLPPLRFGRGYRVFADQWHKFDSGDWQYWCVIAFEIGVALACLGWYGFANSSRFSRLARPVVGVGYVGLIIGLGGMLYGIFKYLVG